jgi:DNA replication protein DnaC
VDEAEAQAMGWIPLERRAWFGRWRVDIPCDCAAGLRVVADWQQLPPDAAGVTLESLFDHPDQDQAYAATEAFCANPVGWLTFGGTYGVGKTALLYAALNRLAERHRYGRYTTAPELIDKLRNLVRAGGDPDRYLDRWCDAPLIAIDELDKYDPTEFAEKSLFRLFNARYQRWQTSGTLIAYNLDRQDRLPAFLRSRIADGRFRFVRLAGADVRPGLGGDAWEREEEVHG